MTVITRKTIVTRGCGAKDKFPPPFRLICNQTRSILKIEQECFCNYDFCNGLNISDPKTTKRPSKSTTASKKRKTTTITTTGAVTSKSFVTLTKPLFPLFFVSSYYLFKCFFSTKT